MANEGKQEIVIRNKAADETRRDAYAEAVNQRLGAARNGEIDPMGYLNLKFREYTGVLPQEREQVSQENNYRTEDKRQNVYWDNPHSMAREKLIEALLKQAADKNAVMPTYP